MLLIMLVGYSELWYRSCIEQHKHCHGEEGEDSSQCSKDNFSERSIIFIVRTENTT